MTAVTATPQPASASVALQITGAPAGAVSITRADVNGVNPVRLRDGQVPIAGAMTVIDAEPALTGPLAYTVTDYASARADVITSLDGLVGHPVVAAVQVPQLAVAPPLVTGYDAGRQSASTVHTVIGRADPIVTLGSTALRVGGLQLFFTDHDAAHAADATLAGPYLYLLRQPTHPGLDMYFAVSETRVTPLTPPAAAGWRWQLDARYVEVRRPNGPLLGSPGWSWDAVAAGFPTWDALPVVFPTWAALAVGP